MAPLVEKLRRLGWTLTKALLRFTFMFINNCVAIPSYCLYFIVLQPLRMVHRSAFWHVEGVMYRWLLAMVASWGWCAGYTDGSQKPFCEEKNEVLEIPPGWLTNVRKNDESVEDLDEKVYCIVAVAKYTKYFGFVGVGKNPEPLLLTPYIQ